MSVATGNGVQIAGVVVGAGLIYVAAAFAAPAAVRIALMILGWIAIYLFSHAIAHWGVGQLAGIRFRGYGLRGTDHPEIYPPGIRTAMSRVPFFVTLTEKASMQRAGPAAKAMMFGAGETSTTVCTLAAAWYVMRAGAPGGRALLIFTVLWNLGATVTTSLVPTGDYAKARRALRPRGPN